MSLISDEEWLYNLRDRLLGYIRNKEDFSTGVKKLEYQKSLLCAFLPVAEVRAMSPIQVAEAIKKL